MRWIYPVAALLWIITAGARAQTLADRPTVSFDQLANGFAEPPRHYAPFVFWFWDEPLNTAKMQRMASEMASKGLNPGYAHPRSAAPGIRNQHPLPPEQWLAPEWFEAFDAALDAAVAQGAQLGYCDEYMWPSLSAAGRVLTQHPELQAVSLRWETFDLEPGVRQDLPPCDFAVIGHLAGSIPARPAAAPRRGAWIWQPQPGAGEHRCWFRRIFTIPEDASIEQAQLRITCDNRFKLWLNGEFVDSSDDWHHVRTYEITMALKPGRNVIAVEGGGDGGLDALSAGLRVTLTNGQQITVTTGSDWKVSSTERDGWQQPEFDDSRWTAARVVNPDPAAAIWNLQDNLSPHTPAQVRGSTLKLLGTGKGLKARAPQDTACRVWVFHRIPQGTVNYLDRRLGPAFIRIAHEPYARRYGRALGQTIPGVFVDNEGDYGWRLAWSDDLAKHFRQRFRKDIRLNLPLMLDTDVEGQTPAARWRWYEAVSDLYAHTMGSVSGWLARRGAYCIENLWEETLQWQAMYVGDFFKLSRAYTMPGNDCLQLGALAVHDFKEASSVSEFEGRRMMSEIMGAGGWGTFTPAIVKQCTNAVIAWGVGHIVPHGVFTHRDLEGNIWTPDWYTANPFWPWMGQWADFSRRASYVNSHGRLVPDVLLLNPMDSVWALTPPAVFDPATTGTLFATDGWFGPEIERINRVYSDAINRLTAHRIEFLIADRHYVQQMQIQQGMLTRGAFTFRAVVMPPMTLLPQAVARRLADFAEAGGHVYVLGGLPTDSPEAGANDPFIRQQMGRLSRAATCHRSGDDGLQAWLDAGAPGLAPQVRFITGEFPLLTRHVRHDGRDLFWMVNNTGDWRTAELSIRQVRGAVAIWDCESGRQTPVASRVTASGSRITVHFRPYEAYWLVFDTTRPANTDPDGAETARVLHSIDGPWTVRYDPTDQPDLQFPHPPPDSFLQGLEKPLEPWTAWGLERFSGRLTYGASFTLDVKPAGPVTLDLGEVQVSASVRLNGRTVGSRLWPPHRFDVAEALQSGVNRLEIVVGNLVNNSYGDIRAGGLLGPVRLLSGGMDAHPPVP